MKPQQMLEVAVVLERTAAPNHWEDWQFRVVDVVPDEGAFGRQPRCMHDDGKTSRWLYPGFSVGLFADECKGYFLNLTSGRPAWFVSWQVDAADPSMATLTGVGVSYIEADRRMTADERVDNIPLEPELCEWLRVFTNEHFRPDSARKVRAMSFLSPEERERQSTQVAAPPAGTVADTAPVPVATSDAQMRNEALRRMFHTDPHFRSSDGLNVAVDEVFEVEGSAQGRQRKIQQARALGMLDDELVDQERPDAGLPPKPAA